MHFDQDPARERQDQEMDVFWNNWQRRCDSASPVKKCAQAKPAFEHGGAREKSTRDLWHQAENKKANRCW